MMRTAKGMFIAATGFLFLLAGLWAIIYFSGSSNESLNTSALIAIIPCFLLQVICIPFDIILITKAGIGWKIFAAIHTIATVLLLVQLGIFWNKESHQVYN